MSALSTSSIPTMQPVQSSQIAEVGYSATDSALFIRFRRGTDIYRYPSFTAEQHAEMMEAPSIGKYFGANVKSLSFEKIAPGTATAERVTAVEHNVGHADSSHEGRSPLVLRMPVRPDSLVGAVATNAPAVAEVQKRSADLSEQAKTIEVIDIGTQRAAEELLLAVASARTSIQQTFKPMKEAANRTHKTICEQERTLESPLQQAETYLKSQIGAYVMAQRRAAQEAERKQVEENRLRADQEALAESHRLAIDDAVALEESGDTHAAEAVLAAPAPVAPRYIPTMPVRPEVAKSAGVTHSTVVKFVVENFDLIPREYLIVDEKAIGSVVKGLGMRTKIPGVRVYEDVQVAAARR